MKITKIDWQNFQPEASLFKNKTILVTGAADGIGKAATLDLAKYGATVIMLDKKARHMEKLYDQIVEQGYQQPVLLPHDLLELSPQIADTIASGIEQDFGQLDGLLHNAAELGSPSPLDQYDFEYWNKVMQTNLQAPYILTRSLLPLLNKAENASILFSSADSGRNPKAYWGAYSIAYAGIEAQMKIWADELENPTNIKVNSIDPGAVRTSFRRRSHPGESQDSLLTPAQITMGYLYLLSGEHTLNGKAIKLQGD